MHRVLLVFCILCLVPNVSLAQQSATIEESQEPFLLGSPPSQKFRHNEKIEGEVMVIVDCVITDKARFKCEVEDESPSGYEFGKRTVDIVEKEVKINRKSPRFKVGERVKFRWKWTKD